MDERLRRWMEASLGGLTPVQREATPAILAGDHVLVSSPTGSGKTLAAFLAILTGLASSPAGPPGIRCVYVSPLRALVNDMERSLLRPIEGAGLDVRVAVRTGDTPPHERARQARTPPDVLVTTPESLALLLASPKARAHLLGVRWVVVDEIHSLAESKRGTQLALALERLAAYVGDFQRIGLSATASPLPEIARFLGGDRPVRIVCAPAAAAPELEVEAAGAGGLAPAADAEERTLDVVEREIARGRTLLAFTNTRNAAERLARQLGARHADAGPLAAAAGAELVLPHHGSMSRPSRLDVEARLQSGHVRCVVASSSLELGIHVEGVDRVVLLGSPKGSARTLQRIGRSGHLPGRTPRATLLVQDPCELPEAHALQALARARRVEDVRIPEQPLDVLMQHLVAIRFELPIDDEAAFRLTRRAHPYRDLGRDAFEAALAARPRLPRHEYLQNAGTIPESGLLKVHHVEGTIDRYVGEVEEDFAATLQEGDVFVLAGRAWRFERSTPARVIVATARTSRGEAPVWRGEGLGATRLLAETLAAILSQRKHDYPWMELQLAWAGPPWEGALVESFPDVDHRAVVFHAMHGRRANEALARALAYHSGHRAVASDWGFAILGPRAWKPTRESLVRLLRAPLAPSLAEALGPSDLFKRRFRQVAMRALLVRRRPGEGLGMRQQEADRLLRRLPDDHPVVREARRECLHDAMDLDAAEAWRASVVEGLRPLRLVDKRPCASPMAARILAPPGEGRHAALREHADAIGMYRALAAGKR